MLAKSADLVASTLAFYGRGPEAELWERVGWAVIDQVEWSPAGGVVVTGVDSNDTVWAAAHTPHILAVARDRAAATVITSTVVPVGSGRAKVTVRRSSPAGELVWLVRLGPGLRADDPAVPVLVDAALRAMRADLGV